MEIEKSACKKNPRVIQQRGGSGGQAHIVDNRANPVQGLMRGGKVSQRVIQRVNEANDKFVYVPHLTPYKMRIPYFEGKIAFTHYRGGFIFSANFTGCFLMAFRFNTTDMHALNALFAPQAPIPPAARMNGRFVAHVSNDIKTAIIDAEARNLITIEAIIRPYNNDTKELVTRRRQFDNNGYSDAEACIRALTGALRHTAHGWEGAVLSQERVPLFGPLPPGGHRDYKWENELLLRWYSVADTTRRTLATKAYLHARKIDSISKKGIGDQVNPYDLAEMGTATSGLVDIRTADPEALMNAHDELTDRDYEPDIRAILNDYYLRRH